MLINKTILHVLVGQCVDTKLPSHFDMTHSVSVRRSHGRTKCKTLFTTRIGKETPGMCYHFYHDILVLLMLTIIVQ